MRLRPARPQRKPQKNMSLGVRLGAYGQHQSCNNQRNAKAYALSRIYEIC